VGMGHLTSSFSPRRVHRPTPQTRDAPDGEYCVERTEVVPPSVVRVRLLPEVAETDPRLAVRRWANSPSVEAATNAMAVMIAVRSRFIAVLPRALQARQTLRPRPA
jgi:hypothetical protein